LSAFGYSGTIAHAVLTCPPDGGTIAQSIMSGVSCGSVAFTAVLAYGRCEFPWRIPVVSESTSMYAACWTPVPLGGAAASGRWLVVATRVATLAGVAPAVPPAPWQTVAVLHGGDKAAAPSMHGLHLTFALGQHLVGIS